MPKRNRTLGPYRGVHTVDVTGLNCNVNIFGVAETETRPYVEGTWTTAGRVKDEAVETAAGVELILTDGSQSARVSRTGHASAGPDGDANSGVRGRSSGRGTRVSRTGDATAHGQGSSANSGIDRTGARVRTHVIRPHDGYQRSTPQSPVTVTMFVTYGTRVLY